MKNKISIVYFNGRFFTLSITGVQRFALELLKALDIVLGNDQTLSQKVNFICLVPMGIETRILPKWKNIHIQKCGRLNGNLWEQIELPFYARRGLLVDLCNIGPLFHFNQIVTFHDASVFAVPEAYSLTFKVKYRVIMWVLGRIARQVLTVSQFSKNELEHYLQINKEKIIIVSEGCEHILNTDPNDSIIENENIPDTPYLLAVGSSSPHKNLESVVKAIENSAENSIPLVIAGGSFSKVFVAVKQIESQKIIHLGYVTDGKLRSLYFQAIGFIFPSVYEGFGLPPLEAMACGCPVICSNRASLPEICGDAALYFDPLNVQEIGNQINRLVVDSSLRGSLIQSGFRRAKQYTWEKSALSFLIVLQKHLPS